MKSEELKDKSINTAKLAQLVGRNLCIEANHVFLIMKEAQKVMVEELRAGNNIYLSFGVLKIKIFKAQKRKVQFPARIVEVPERKFVKFYARRILKEIITNGKNIDLWDEKKLHKK